MLSQVLSTAFSFSDSSYFVGIACSDCFRRLLEVIRSKSLSKSKTLQFRQQSKLQNWESVKVYGDLRYRSGWSNKSKLFFISDSSNKTRSPDTDIHYGLKRITTWNMTVTRSWERNQISLVNFVVSISL